jgi:hypothetical protein
VAVTALLLYPRQYPNIIVTALVCCISAELAYGRQTVHNAAVLWARFGKDPGCELPSALLSIDRSLRFRYITSWCIRITWLLWPVNIYLLCRLNGGFSWTFFFYALAGYAGGTVLLFHPMRQLAWRHRAQFLSEVNAFPETLRQIFDAQWQYDTPENHDPLLHDNQAFILSNGHYMYFGLLLGIFWVKISLPVSITFNIFYFLLFSGLLISSYFRPIQQLLVYKDYFSKPVFPAGSRILSLHILHSIWLETAWVTFTTGVVFSLCQNMTARFIAIPFAAFAGRFLLGNGTIRMAKRVFNYQFNILVFRRFSPEFAKVTKTVINPVLGAYGNLLSINDPSLRDAKEGINADSEGILNERNQLQFSTGESWRTTVQLYLNKADVVVFQWEDLPSPNMEWEFREACRVIPPQRVLFICRQINETRIRDRILEISSGQQLPYRFLTASQEPGLRNLNKAVYRLFRELRQEPRVTPCSIKIVL